MDEQILPVQAEDAAAKDTILPYAAPVCYTDRELSWLQFNLRVLMEAGDKNLPLLERLKFISIYQNNLDEFFMVRVGSLVHRNILMPDYFDPKTGWTTAVQLKKISREVMRQQEIAGALYRELLQDLKRAGIEVLDFNRITKADESMVRKVFAEIRQLLSPRIVDSAHPMPFLGNQESFVAALLKKGDKYNLGLIYLSRLPAFQVFEGDTGQKVAMTDELVQHFAPLLFKKHDIKDCRTIRVTRNADVFIEENSSSLDEDFRSSMEKLLKKRNRQQIVRLEISGEPDRRLRDILEKQLHLSEKQVYFSGLPFHVDFSSKLKHWPALRYAERRSVRTVALRKGEYFRYLEKRDMLLSFPYQSMMPFIEMLYEAADDPEVVSIRITLYRLAASSKLAAALAYAADQGKDVLCLLELRARFDEKNNIDYSEVLEEAGCSVIYGLPGQKVHSKLCLITRKCADGVRYITQIGTGNYNEVTGEQYCDLSYITSDPQIGTDAVEIFEALALGQTPEPTKKLITAPVSFKPMLLEALDAEIAKGSEGYVAIKCNSMNDLDVMDKFIACSKAGVSVNLYIRGICCLLPGIPGETENIHVRSVIGRYLEHSRIYVFGKGSAQRIFIGSGDLLNRNTQRRVEAFAEITDPEIQRQILEVLAAVADDDAKGWDMQPDGSYTKADTPKGSSSQERLYRYFTAQHVEPLPPEPEPRRGLFRRRRRK